MRNYSQEQTPVKDKKIVKRLIKDAGRIKWGLLVCCVISVLAITCHIFAPEFLGRIVAYIDDYIETGVMQDKLLTKSIIILASLYLGYGIFSYLKMFSLNNIVSRFFTCNLRIRISDKITRLPISYIDKTRPGEILSRMDNNVSTMGNTIHGILGILIEGFVQIIAITVMMFLKNWLMALIVICFVPLSVFLSIIISTRSEKHFHSMHHEIGKMYSHIEETYGGYQTVKANHLEKRLLDKHSEINGRITKSMNKAYFLSGSVQYIIAFTNNLAYVIICLVGGYLALKNGYDISLVASIIFYAKMFSSPLENIANGISQMHNAGSASKRVYDLLDEKEMAVQTKKLSANTDGNVEFKDVSFSYSADKPLIQDLNLQVKKGQKIAIVGPTGAGKTTMVNLLMRFYDVDKGAIYIDGENICDADRNSVREKFAMVLQDTWLFKGTVYENVAYGKSGVGREDIERACDHAYCDRFIRTLPDGYETVIDENSANISAGQKQLLTIARAFLSDRPLLILDEATSNVDTRTEILIQKAMDNLMKGRTCFVIAHRLSTIVDADNILVVDNGNIVETGTHSELLKKNGFYAKIYNSQYDIL